MSDFGFKLGIDGEKQFKSALSEINQSFRVLGSEMKLAESQFDKQDKSMESIAATSEVLTKQITAQGEKVDFLRQALKNASDSFGENDKRTQAWAMQLNNAQAELNNLERELGQNNKALDEFGDESKQAGSEIKQAGEKAEESGKNAEKGGGGWERLGSVVGGVGAAMAAAVAAMGAAAVAAGSALVKFSVDGAAYADEVITMATVTGLTTEQIQEFKYMQELVDVPIETMTKSMAKQIKAMAEAAKVTGEATVDYAKLEKAQVKVQTASLGVESAQIKYNDAVAKYGKESSQAQQAAIALEKAQINLTAAAREVQAAQEPAGEKTNAMSEAYAKLGVSVTDMAGNLRDGQDVYWEVIEALSQIQNETERDAIAMQILGKSAQELKPLMDVGAEGIKELAAQAHEAGYVMSGDTLEAFGAFDDNLQRLKTGSEAAKNALGGILLPVLTQLSGEGVDLLGKFTRGINAANGDISQMGGVISDVLGDVVNIIAENLPIIVDAGLNIVMALINGITDNISVIVSSATEIIQTLVSGLTEALPQLLDGALQIVLSLVNALIDNLPKILEAGITILMELIKGIVDALPKLIPAAIDAILQIVDALIDNIDLLIDASIAIVIGLTEGIIDALPRLIEKAPVIIEKLITAIINNVPKLIEAAFEIIVSLGKGLIENIPLLLKSVGDVLQAIIKGFIDFGPKIAEVGKNIISSLWEGMKSMGKWLGDQVSGFFGGVVDGIKGFLGIASPSKVFAGIGENMGLGIGDGFKDAMTDVEKDMQKAIPTNFGFGGQLALAGGGGNNIINHSGTIRVEGINDKNQLVGVAEMLLDTIRRESRR